MRNLAEICTVEKVWPLPNKDRVVGCSLVENSYEFMVSKDTKPGDVVAFIQEGSILPVTPTWEWLRARCYVEKLNGFLIRVQKFADIRSWGLIVPLDQLGLDSKQVSKLKPGDDITDLLGIKKFEPEEDASPRASSKKAYPAWVKFCLRHFLTRWIGRLWQRNHQNSAGGFPSEVISKSDETTIQNRKGLLEANPDALVYVSTKMEGQSVTVLCDYDRRKNKLGKFYPCSRNNAYRLKTNNDFWKASESYGIEKKLRDYFAKTGKALVIQAEQCGPGIQDNIYNLPNLTWFIYEIKDAVTDTQLPVDEMVQVANELGIPTVPIFMNGIPLKSIMPDIKAAEAFAEKLFWTVEKGDNGTIRVIHNYRPKENDVFWKDYFQEEGCVVRSIPFDKDKNIGFSFKVKNAEYQLPAHSLGIVHTAAHQLLNK